MILSALIAPMLLGGQTTTILHTVKLPNKQEVRVTVTEDESGYLLTTTNNATHLEGLSYTGSASTALQGPVDAKRKVFAIAVKVKNSELPLLITLLSTSAGKNMCLDFVKDDVQTGYRLQSHVMGFERSQFVEWIVKDGYFAGYKLHPTYISKKDKKLFEETGKLPKRWVTICTFYEPESVESGNESGVYNMVETEYNPNESIASNDHILEKIRWTPKR